MSTRGFPDPLCSCTHTAGGTVRRFCRFGKRSHGALQGHCTPVRCGVTIPLAGFPQGNCTHASTHRLGHRCSRRPYPRQLAGGNNPHGHQATAQAKCMLHTTEEGCARSWEATQRAEERVPMAPAPGSGRCGLTSGRRGLLGGARGRGCRDYEETLGNDGFTDKTFTVQFLLYQF